MGQVDNLKGVADHATTPPLLPQQSEKGSEYGKIRKRDAQRLLRDRVELPIGLDRVDESIQPLQKFMCIAANTNPEMGSRRVCSGVIVLPRGSPNQVSALYAFAGCSRILFHDGFATRRAAFPDALLNWCRGMLTMIKRRRSWGSVSKSASTKISTVSSLA